MTAGGAGRRFLLLQGPSSSFFSHLGDALAERGAEVLRIHLCPGDALFWRRAGGRSYRGLARGWPTFARRVMAEAGITDLVFLGARRPAHAEAIAEARALGVRRWHVELGYVRPDWLTVEPEGGGADGTFPESWPEIEALACGPVPEETRLWRGFFAGYAVMDVAWNLSNLALSWATHPGYRRHRTWHPLAEYAGFLWTQARGRSDAAHARRVLDAWRGSRPFLFPLQLRTDYQIRAHGPDPDLRDTVRRTVESFAAEAPPGARLLLKEHPQDNGLTAWRRLAKEAAGAAEAQVEVIRGGDLAAMLGDASGVVAVNSTVGISALRAGVPAKALGRAIWDREGLTDRRALAAFWADPAPPDPRRVETFLRALGWATQVRGAFDGPGARPGAAAVAERLLSPPRLPFRDRGGALSPPEAPAPAP
jgi:capsular polysaccharide export protein